MLTSEIHFTDRCHINIPNMKTYKLQILFYCHHKHKKKIEQFCSFFLNTWDFYGWSYVWTGFKVYAMWCLSLESNQNNQVLQVLKMSSGFIIASTTTDYAIRRKRSIRRYNLTNLKVTLIRIKECIEKISTLCIIDTAAYPGICRTWDSFACKVAGSNFTKL